MSSQFDPIPMMSSQPDPAPAPTAESNPIRDAIAEAIGEHRVILFMKGTPEAPACGFSARTVAALQSLEVPFAAVDILPDQRIRQELSVISNWPTWLMPTLSARVRGR
jgi:glutaredoxin-related protein